MTTMTTITTLTANALLVGLPGSGKSTLCNQLVAEGYVVVSTDAAREAIGGDAAVQHPWPEVWAKCLQLAAAAKAAGKPVAYDATNILPEHRKNVMEELGGSWVAYVATTPLEDCLRRNAARDRVVPEHVIHSMAKRYVPPSLDEGFLELRYF